MQKILLITILSLASAGRVTRSADHHGDGHDDNCVDISKYGPVVYNETTSEVCSYKLKTSCTKRSQQVCTTVPVAECNIVGYTNCENTKTTVTVRDDSIVGQQFTRQNCVVGSQKETLTEVKKMPVCKNVTKQQCDTVWVVNDLGEKVWAGNDNCEEVTWEDCTLEDRIVEQEVDVWVCTPDTEPISYQILSTNTVDVVKVGTVCEARADPVCTYTSVQRCVTVEWEDCLDTVKPNCITAGFKTPYQEYDHRLRCSVTH